MKKLLQILKTRFTLSLLFVFGLAFSVHAQKDILLYSSDITDWTAEDHSGASSGDTFTPSTGAGAGFVIGGQPVVNPSVTAGPYTGTIKFLNSGGNITIKPLTYIAGGVVVLDYYYMSGTSTRTVTMAGSNNVSFEAAQAGLTRYDALLAGTMFMSPTTSSPDRVILDASKLNVWYPGSSFAIREVGAYRVAYQLPATFTGLQTLNITGFNTNIAIASIKVYTSVGTTPYIASTNYPQAPASGHSMSGAIAGAKYSGTDVNAKVKIRSWNISSDATVTIEGADAAKFSFSNAADVLTTTIPSAQLANPAEKTLDIYFTPSVISSIANAQLKITAPGVANPYYVSLSGLTGGATPQIIADNSTLPFWTSLIAKTTQTLDVAGMNLTGDVSISVTGPGASRFSLSTNTISKSEAASGSALDITFTGDINPTTLNASLVLSSPGAPSITVPLVAYTSTLKPKLFSLEFAVDPAGTAYVTKSPGGSKYLDGSSVEVTITPETGWKIKYWQDATGNKRSERTFVVNELKNTDNGAPIIIFMEPGIQIDPVTSVGALVALQASSITSTGFTANWTAVVGASTYTIKIYDENETLLQTLSSASTSIGVTSLSANTKYKYSVSTSYVDSGTGSTVNLDTPIVGPFTTSKSIGTFICGQ